MSARSSSPHGSTFQKVLAFLGPGLFLIAYNVGTGTVTTMASAGSRWGVSLSWTVVLSCFFTYVGIILFTKYTLVTGDTILYAVRSRLSFGKPIAIGIMLSLIMAEFAGIAGLMAIIVDLLQEWVRYATGHAGEAVKLATTAGVLILIGIVLWKGTYALLEKVMAVMVGAMGLSFLITAVVVVPSWREILAGLAPAVPGEANATLIIAGMAGTTFSTALFFARSITIKAKGWTLADEGRARTDAAVSIIALLALSMAVMVCAAGTLYRIGQPVEAPLDMVRTLEPLAGRFAISLFIFGVVAAGISSLVPTILIAPWLVSDYENRPIDPSSTVSRLFVIAGLAIGAVAPYIPTAVAKPVFIMIITMALLAVVSPFSMIAIALLLNQKKSMGERTNTLAENVACFAAIGFSFAISYFGVVGLLDYIGSAAA
jgi:Mn2+/Fe2+ NRAMP family transporter